jgi:NAD(P)-dependent dehydrogenase (short-subunit alcohol dehydrogenase family)
MYPTSELSDRTTVVVGASRGLGRGIAMAFAQAGAPVVAVACTAAALNELQGGAGGVHLEVADASLTPAPVKATRWRAFARLFLDAPCRRRLAVSRGVLRLRAFVGLLVRVARSIASLFG